VTSQLVVVTMSWCTIESDPGVFSELIEHLGVKDVDVTEVYSFDAVETHQREGCMGFIYLFKYVPEDGPPVNAVVDAPEGMFFARQIVQDACATQALLSILMNVPESEIELGEMLNDFKGFAGVLDSESMGITIGNHDGIRSVHNSFARPEPFVMDDDDKKKLKGKKADVFHFVAYIPFQGNIYELDGLKPGPTLLGSINNDNGNTWFDNVKPHIETRMARANDINSVLLAVGKSQLLSLQLELENERNNNSNNNSNSNQAVINNLTELINDYKISKNKQKSENILRRHNFFPLILNLCQVLSKSGNLNRLYDDAKERKLNRINEERARADANAAKNT
jgi:ubiquitin carboxyl-terminal hydrolase L5